MSTELAFPIADVPPDPAGGLTYRRVTDTRNPKAAYHYRIVIPTTWRPVAVPTIPPTSEAPLQVLGLLRDPEDRRAEIEILGVHMDREVGAVDWLDILLAEREETILTRRSVDARLGPVPDVLTRLETPEGAIVSRWLVLKDGPHFFVLHARAHEADYPRFAQVFLTAMQGLVPLHLSSWPLAELLRPYSRSAPGDYLLLHPDSWILTEDRSNNEDVHGLDLINLLHGDAVGRITFVTIKRSREPDPQGVVAKYVARVNLLGADVPVLDLSPAPPAKAFDRMWTARASALRDNLEIRVVVGERPDAWFLIALMGASRRAAPELWAINKRAHELVVELLRTPETP